MTKFIVKCDKCDFRKETSSYERAKDLRRSHHIPTGHHPVIKEKE